MNLAKVLKISYMDKDKQKKKMARQGYQYDSMLSNGDSQIYYNPTTGKLLNTITGTHNKSDILTDIALTTGFLKNTSRYKDAHRTLREAKKKYGVDSATIAAHSLGSSIGAGIASKQDKFYGLDAGYTIGQKTRSNGGNHHHYRTAGDAVSMMSGNAKNMTTLENKNEKSWLPHVNALKAHDIGNIKKAGIFID